MREIRTSGLMSGDEKRATASRSRTAPVLDSTKLLAKAVLCGITEFRNKQLQSNGERLLL